jgi:NAD(P)-dependent dehydrogenase (short-subunit alcohol dehydrogenase family)
MVQTLPILQRLFSLEGKTALVTGASSGIGRALAVAFAEAGAAVGVHGRDVERVEETCEEIVKIGGRAVPLVADLGTVDVCRDMIAKAHAELGRLDILVNNAGMNRRKRIEDVTPEDFDTITATNTRSLYFLSQAAHRIMRSQGGGKIIHIGSLSVFFGLDMVSVYGSTKGAVAQLTKVMAVEWARDNIQVNCVTPGFIYTPLSKPIWEDEYKANWLRTRIASHRAGLPEDLVGLTLLLASQASDYITGQNIIVDGGFIAGGSWERDAAELPDVEV